MAAHKVASGSFALLVPGFERSSCVRVDDFRKIQISVGCEVAESTVRRAPKFGAVVAAPVQDWSNLNYAVTCFQVCLHGFW